MDAIQPIDAASPGMFELVKALLETPVPQNPAEEAGLVPGADASSMGTATAPVELARGEPAAAPLSGPAMSATHTASPSLVAGVPLMAAAMEGARREASTAQAALPGAARSGSTTASPSQAAGNAPATAAWSAPIAAVAGEDAGARNTVLRHDPATASAARPTDAVALNVLASSLHSQPAHLRRADTVPTEPPGRRQGDAQREAWEQALDAKEAEDAVDAHEDADDGSPPGDLEDWLAHADPGYASLRRRLADNAQREAVRELDLRRRVMLIVPRQPMSTRRGEGRVHLLVPHARGDGGEAHAFRIDWWPGARPPAAWTAWRLHREGAGSETLLRSRAAGTRHAPLLMRLGRHGPSLHDAGTACADLAEAQRFDHLLGMQWSLMGLLCLPTDLA